MPLSLVCGEDGRMLSRLPLRQSAQPLQSAASGNVPRDALFPFIPSLIIVRCRCRTLHPRRMLMQLVKLRVGSTGSARQCTLGTHAIPVPQRRCRICQAPGGRWAASSQKLDWYSRRALGAPHTGSATAQMQSRSESCRTSSATRRKSGNTSGWCNLFGELLQL